MPSDRLFELLTRLRQEQPERNFGDLLDSCLETGDRLASMPDAVLEDRIGRYLILEDLEESVDA
jgi:hypothetical protein